MEEKAILGVPWTVLSYAANKVIATLTTLVLAHLLSPSDFGVIAIPLVVLNFLFWFGGLSFASTLIVRQDLDELGKATALTLMLCSGAVAAGIAAAVAPAIAAIFHDPRITGVMLGLTSVFVLSSFTSFYEALLQRDLEFRRRFAGLAVQTIGNASVSILLAALGAGVWSLVFGQVASYALYAIALMVLVPRRIRPRFERSRARSLIITGRGFLTQGVTLFIRQNVDTLAVGRALGAGALGFYSMANKLGDLSYWAIADPVARVTFPAFSRSLARGEDIRGSFLSVLRLIALVGCPVGVILSAAADPFTRAVFGTRWLPMVGPLTVFGLWAAIRPIDSTLFWLLNTFRRADLVAWLSAAMLVPLIPGIVLALQIGKLTAVATVVVIDSIISVFTLAFFVSRHAEISLSKLWGAVSPIVLASPVAWIAAYVAGHAVRGHSPILSLAIAILAGLTAYGAMLSLLDRSLLGHAAGQLLRVFGRHRQHASPAPDL